MVAAKLASVPRVHPRVGRSMAAAMPDDAQKHQMLYQHEVGVGAMRWRRARHAKVRVDTEIAAGQRATAVE